MAQGDDAAALGSGADYNNLHARDTGLCTSDRRYAADAVRPAHSAQGERRLPRGVHLRARAECGSHNIPNGALKRGLRPPAGAGSRDKHSAGVLEIRNAPDAVFRAEKPEIQGRIESKRHFCRDADILVRGAVGVRSVGHTGQQPGALRDTDSLHNYYRLPLAHGQERGSRALRRDRRGGQDIQPGARRRHSWRGAGRHSAGAVLPGQVPDGLAAPGERRRA